MYEHHFGISGPPFKLSPDPTFYFDSRSHREVLEVAKRGLAKRHGIGGIRSAVERPTLAWLTEPARGLEAGLLTGLAWLTRRQMGARRHGPQVCFTAQEKASADVGQDWY